MRRGILSFGLLALCTLLTACVAGAGATTGGGSQPTVIPASPTPNVLALNANDTSSQVASVCGGVFKADGGTPQTVYQLGPTIYAEAVWGLPYASYQLPADLPVGPWAMPAEPGSAQLEQQLGGAANLNPGIGQGGGILLTVCNASAQPLTLAGAQVVVASFAPASGAVDAWNGCDGAFVRPQGLFGGGCGGAIIADETMSASFASGAGQYATVKAIQVAAAGQNGFGPLPVTLNSGVSISLSIGVTRPSALGTYEFAVSVTTSAAGGASVSSPYAPLPPQLFALVAHKFTGQACTASAMQTQIPAAVTNHSTYYICLES
jgi:hypothetical protein